MMGGLSVDADLMESLTPEPFMNVKYPFCLFCLFLKVLNSHFVIFFFFYFLFASYLFFSIPAAVPFRRQWRGKTVGFKVPPSHCHFIDCVCQSFQAIGSVPALAHQSVVYGGYFICYFLLLFIVSFQIFQDDHKYFIVSI